MMCKGVISLSVVKAQRQQLLQKKHVREVYESQVIKGGREICWWSVYECTNDQAAEIWDKSTVHIQFVGLLWHFSSLAGFNVKLRSLHKHMHLLLFSH